MSFIISPTANDMSATMPPVMPLHISPLYTIPLKINPSKNSLLDGLLFSLIFSLISFIASRTLLIIQKTPSGGYLNQCRGATCSKFRGRSGQGHAQ